MFCGKRSSSFVSVVVILGLTILAGAGWSAASGQTVAVDTQNDAQPKAVVSGADATATLAAQRASGRWSPAVSAGTGPSGNGSSAVPLIPLNLLLGPSRFRNPQVSPDGRLLAFIRPGTQSGVNSVFVTALPPSSGSSGVGNTAGSSTNSGSSSGSPNQGMEGQSLMEAGLLQPVQVTNTKLPVSDYFWSKDNTAILFVVDSGSGSEDYHLFWVPITVSNSIGSRLSRSAISNGSAGGAKPQQGQAVKISPGKAVNLTPWKGVKVQGLWFSSNVPDRVLLGLNKRNKRVFDIYSINLKTHAATLHTVNPGNVTTWVVDADFDISAGVIVAPDGSRHLVLRDNRTADGCPPATEPAATAAAAAAPPTAVYATAAAAAAAGSDMSATRESAAAAATAPGAVQADGSASEQQQTPAGTAGAAVAAAAPDGSIGNRRLLQAAGSANMDARPGPSSSNSGDGSKGQDGQAPAAGAVKQPPAPAAAAAPPSTKADSSSSSRRSSGSSQMGVSNKGVQQQGGQGEGRKRSAGANGEDSLDRAVQGSSSRSSVACWRLLHTWALGEEGRAFGFNKAGDGLFLTTSVDRDTTELRLVSTSPNNAGAVLQRVASHPLVDINDVVFDPTSREPDALALDYHTAVWSFKSPDDQAEWDKLEAWRPHDVLGLISRSRDKKVWVLEYTKGNGNAGFYLHRRGAFPPQLLFYQQPALNNYTLATTHPVVVTARDGLKVPGYLTLPVLPGLPSQLPPGLAGNLPDLHSFNALQRTQGTPKAALQQPQQPGVKAKVARVDWKLPLVLVVHGGPWKRAVWGSNAGIVQWLANRGYAVLNMNFRGSTGYGKAFTNKGDGQWGVGSMQHDLSDAVAWAVKRGIADPKKVCIIGASYGGYATFSGMVFTPQLYQCGVSFSGIANLAEFVRAMPPYWAPLRNRWLLRVGNVTADEALNQKLSPVYHAKNVRAPLLIGQGSNDVRVVQAEADAMYGALKQHGAKGVQYVLYPDEGHSITRMANRLDFYSRAEHVLADALGGRRDKPLRPKNSSAKVMTR